MDIQDEQDKSKCGTFATQSPIKKAMRFPCVSFQYEPPLILSILCIHVKTPFAGEGDVGVVPARADKQPPIIYFP